MIDPRRLSPDERQRMEELFGYFTDDELTEHLFAVMREALASDADTRRHLNQQIDELARYVHAREH